MWPPPALVSGRFYMAAWIWYCIVGGKASVWYQIIVNYKDSSATGKTLSLLFSFEIQIFAEIYLISLASSH